mmetsp:Transcript_16922/g.38870  ORF Transcript_16922/g.38870 Transcript_16922/m.38870 type:complete len:94 (-) Transcript_16922:95-376(-)
MNCPRERIKQKTTKQQTRKKKKKTKAESRTPRLTHRSRNSQPKQINVRTVLVIHNDNRKYTIDRRRNKRQTTKTPTTADNGKEGNPMRSNPIH